MRVNSPAIDIAVLYNGFLSLRLFLLPTLEPLVHLRSGGFTADVHRGDHLLSLDREREAGEFKERAMFRIWHSVHVKVHVGALRLPRSHHVNCLRCVLASIDETPVINSAPLGGENFTVAYQKPVRYEPENATYDHPVGRSPMTLVKVSFQLPA